MRALTKLIAMSKLAAATLLLISLSSCLISGDVDLLLTDILVTTDVSTASIGSPVTATLEIRGIWVHGALASRAVAKGRLELCVVPSPNDPIKYCREAPAGQLSPGVRLLPGETLRKDVNLLITRNHRGEIAVDTHTVGLTSDTPQELILVTRFMGTDGGNWAFDPERRRATVTFEPVN